MIVLKVLSAISVASFASVTLKAKLYVVSEPTMLGVPDSIPVVLFNVNPVGNVPLNTA